MQELGGKHKENVALLSRKGDILPRAVRSLAKEIQQLYEASGSEVWISRLVFQGTAAHAAPTDPASQKCPARDTQAPSVDGEMIETAGEAPERADFFPDPAIWLDDKLIPQGDAAGFTGLATLYVVKTSVLDARRLCMVDFDSHILRDPRSVLSSWGHGDDIDILEEFMPPPSLCRHAKLHISSRKGFLATRWFVRGAESSDGSEGAVGAWFNVVNVHLIHDDSNEQAAQATPSSAAKLRAKMIALTQRLIGINHQVPTLMAGDFNFRLDLESVVRELNGRVKVLGKSKMEHDVIGDESWALLREYDRELLRFNEAHPAHQLLEYEAPTCRWPCTYPVESFDAQGHKTYCTKRFPCWTDRVLGTQAFWALCKTTLPRLGSGGVGTVTENGEGGTGGDGGAVKYGATQLSGLSDHDAVFMIAEMVT